MGWLGDGKQGRVHPTGAIKQGTLSWGSHHSTEIQEKVLVYVKAQGGK